MDHGTDSAKEQRGICLSEKEEFCDQIRQNAGAMYRLAYALMHNDEDASEVLSEAIYRAYKNYTTLRNPQAFKTWILKIVHNTAVEMIRKNARLVPLEQTEQLPTTAFKEDLTTRILLREAVESLKQPYRTVTVLYYYENLSVNEIAKITKTHRVTVRQQLTRSRKMLFEKLKEDFKK